MSPFTLWRWSSGSREQNHVVSENDAIASEGIGRYPRVSTGFKKTYSVVDVSNRGTVEDMLLQKPSLFCYWRSWRELTQCSEEYRKQAVALHQLILCYRFSTSQSIHTSFREIAGSICAASLRWISAPGTTTAHKYTITARCSSLAHTKNAAPIVKRYDRTITDR
jgi:hypothetical protein